LGLLVATAVAALAFWPQAGVLGQDLYFANSVDLDPAAGATLDPWCGHRTYDTHTGDDVTIRSFREVMIGVPVFSLTEGTINEVQDGEFDFHFGTATSQFDNHLIVDAGDGRQFVYGHLRHGLPWHRGQSVHEGEQIGWTASSGNSSWPHLHLTERIDFVPRDPFAGPCRPGPSDFAEQPQAFRDAPYVRNLVVSPKPFRGEAELPWDGAVRTGTFVRGTRELYFRVELGEYRGGTEHVQLRRPDGSVALDDPSAASTADGVGGPPAHDLHERVRFDAVGTWRLQYSLGGVLLADAPLRVVAQKSQVRNRPPNPVTAAVTVSTVAQCTVGTSLVARDPDYDIVRYRYRWSVGARVLREVTSAGLTDVLQHGLAKPGVTVRCTVTPSDGRASGRPVAASARVPG